jgi:hypothetical protein
MSTACGTLDQAALPLVGPEITLSYGGIRRVGGQRSG